MPSLVLEENDGVIVTSFFGFSNCSADNYSAKVLVLLVSRAGEVVTREELVRQVWGAEVFVDYEQGLNFAVRKIRSALGDDADRPRFLETLPKRGYRFLAPVNGAATFGAPETESFAETRTSSKPLTSIALRAALYRFQWLTHVSSLRP